MTYTAHIRESSSPTAPELLPLGGRVRSIAMAWDTHGAAEATVVARLGIVELLALYEARGTPHLVICYYGVTVWAGRVEKPRLRTGGGEIELVAYGYWRALQDQPYSAVWLDYRSELWRQLLPSDIADATPDRYEMRSDSAGLYMAPTKNAVLGATGAQKMARWGYRIPESYAHGITGVTVNGSIVAPNDLWRFTVSTCNYDWTGETVRSTTNSAIGTTPLAVVTSFTAVRAVMIALYYNPADATFTGETGSMYVRANYESTSAPRVTSGTNLFGLISTVSTANPSQLRSYISRRGTAPIAGFDDSAVFTDADPTGIIAALCERYTAQAWVNNDREFFYESLYAESTSWRIEAQDVVIDRDLGNVYNRVYASYETGAGEYATTADADNLGSQDRYGVARERVVAAPTVSGTTAATVRDVALADSADPSARAGLTVRRVLSRHGAQAALHMPRPGDTAQVVNAPSYTGALGGALSFRVARVELRLAPGRPPEVTIEPDEPTPRLDTLLAQLGG